MRELEIKNRFYSYAFYALSAGIFAMCIILQNGYLTAVSAVLLFISVVYLHSGHMANNLLLKHGSVIEICNGYVLSDELTAAVKRIGNDYFAVSCVLMKSTSGERNGEQISSLVSNVDFPFEFSIGLESVNHERMLDALEEKRRLVEIEIARSDPKKYDRINVLRRELSVMEDEIRSVRGERLFATKIKLKTFARSQSDFEAALETSRNANRIASSFSSVLGFEHEVLKGERLLNELETEGVTV